MAANMLDAARYKRIRLERAIASALIIGGADVKQIVQQRNYQFRDVPCHRLWEMCINHNGTDEALLEKIVTRIVKSNSLSWWREIDSCYQYYIPEDQRLYGACVSATWALDEIDNINTFICSTARLLRLIRDQLWFDPIDQTPGAA